MKALFFSLPLSIGNCHTIMGDLIRFVFDSTKVQSSFLDLLKIPLWLCLTTVELAVQPASLKAQPVSTLVKCGWTFLTQRFNRYSTVVELAVQPHPFRSSTGPHSGELWFNCPCTTVQPPLWFLCLTAPFEERPYIYPHIPLHTIHAINSFPSLRRGARAFKLPFLLLTLSWAQIHCKSLS